MTDQTRKLSRLEDNLRELAHFQNSTLTDLDDDEKVRWALRYGLVESVQLTIDLACAIVNRRNLGDPSRPADCFRFLQEASILSKGVADRLIQTIDARGVLVANDQDVDDAVVLDALDRLADFRTFAREMRDTVPASDATT